MYLGYDEKTNTWVYLDIQEEFMDYINKKKGNHLRFLKELGSVWPAPFLIDSIMVKMVQ